MGFSCNSLCSRDTHVVRRRLAMLESGARCARGGNDVFYIRGFCGNLEDREAANIS